MTTPETKTKPRIGFLGMGHMGSHMAQRLLEAGYQLTVYDRTPENAQEAGRKGASVAQTPLGTGGELRRGDGLRDQRRGEGKP
jgi:6-phosphogluconate dehydrogenase (decarboxylating)